MFLKESIKSYDSISEHMNSLDIVKQEPVVYLLRKIVSLLVLPALILGEGLYISLLFQMNF